jgi:hypothetical protein
MAFRVSSAFARKPLHAGVEYVYKYEEFKLGYIVNDYTSLLLVSIYKVSHYWCTQGGEEVQFCALVQLFF